MATLTAIDDRLVLHSTEVNPDGRGGLGLSVASPILMGLAAPIIAVVLVDPAALGHARFVMVTLLFALAFIASGLFLFTALNPGHVVAVAVIPSSRLVTIVRQGLFGGQETQIPFAEVASLDMVKTYDRDGYGTAEPLLILSDGIAISLPEGTTERHLASLRQALRRN